jgi:hypothetical protein
MSNKQILTLEQLPDDDGGFRVTFNHPSVAGLLIVASNTEAEAAAHVAELMGHLDARPPQPTLADLPTGAAAGLADYDRKAEITENALYRLKERDYAHASDVRRIDDFLALPAEFKVDLYDLIRFHAGPESGK